MSPTAPLPSTPNRRRTRGGFSLVELLAVIVVIGLIAGVVAIDYKALVPRARLNATVREMAATVSGTRSDSIARNAEFRIVYDLDEQLYFVTTPFRAGGGLAYSEEERTVIRRTQMPEDVRISRVVVDGVEYTEGQVVVRFDPLGRASDHLVTIAQLGLTGGEPLVYTLEVLPLTGLVRFHYEDFRREPVYEEDFR